MESLAIIMQSATNSYIFENKVDIVPAPVMNMNSHFTGTSPSFTGLSNTTVVSRRARVGTSPILQ